MGWGGLGKIKKSRKLKTKMSLPASCHSPLLECYETPDVKTNSILTTGPSLKSNTAQHCILHNNAHCTTLFTAQHCTLHITSYFTTKHTEQQCSLHNTGHCATLHCTTLNSVHFKQHNTEHNQHYTAQHCKSQHWTALHCTLHSTEHCTTLHFITLLGLAQHNQLESICAGCLL